MALPLVADDPAKEAVAFYLEDLRLPPSIT